MAASTEYWYATTIDNVEGAAKITTALAGIGNLEVTKIEVLSYFWWDNRVENGSESRIEAHLKGCESAEACGKFAKQVADAISSNHSDLVPMIINGGGETTYPCMQIIVKNVKDELLGKGMVQRRLAGCAQWDRMTGNLYLKTTDARALALLEKVRKEAASAVDVGTPVKINANKEYHDWLISVTRQDEAVRSTTVERVVEESRHTEAGGSTTVADDRIDNPAKPDPEKNASEKKREL